MISASVPAVAVDRLVKVYKNVPAVSGISFALAPGSMTALLGGNGAGKTTTIAMIMGLLEPTAGSVSVLGADMPRQRYRVLHRMNFESPYVEMPRRLTVRQNLEVFARLYGVVDIAARIRTLAQELELADLLDRQTGKLSSGQTADWVRARLERYRRERGATVLLASHNMVEVERLCERVIFLKKGEIVGDDTPRALRARFGRASLEEVFLDVARGGGNAEAAP